MTTLDFTLLAMLSGFFGGQLPYIMRRWAQKTQAERRCRQFDKQKTLDEIFSGPIPSLHVVSDSGHDEPPRAA